MKYRTFLINTMYGEMYQIDIKRLGFWFYLTVAFDFPEACRKIKYYTSPNQSINKIRYFDKNGDILK